MMKIRSLRRLRTTLHAIVAKINIPLTQPVSLTSFRIVSKANYMASQEPWFSIKLIRWSIIRRQKRRARRRPAQSEWTLIRHHHLMAAMQTDILRKSIPGGSNLDLSYRWRSGSRSSSASGRRTHSRMIRQISKPVAHLILTELWRLKTALSLWLLKTL